MTGPFEIYVPGKWVLAGEHSVLKGMPAVALPHPELGMRLRFEPTERGGLQVIPADASGVLHDMLASIPKLQSTALHGRLTIESSVPFGAGLGSSAALCVAVTQWLARPLGLEPNQLVDFATRLENLFHGKSSGMDIAVIAAGAPVRFVRGQGATALGIRKLPRFTFHDTGLRARTSDCIAQVEAFRAGDPAEGRRLDERMGEASCLAADGLGLYDRGDTTQGLERIVESMSISHDCYDRWDLLPAEARVLQSRLVSQGARATRVTGAGGGGMVVALWD